MRRAWREGGVSPVMGKEVRHMEAKNSNNCIAKKCTRSVTLLPCLSCEEQICIYVGLLGGIVCNASSILLFEKQVLFHAHLISFDYVAHTCTVCIPGFKLCTWSA